MFTKAQLDRYARHILLPGVGAAGQRKLLGARVLVVGAGGLGSPILLYLAAAGVGTLGIADFDKVDASNLQRQVLHGVPSLGQAKTLSARQRLLELNPDVSVVLHEGRLEAHAHPDFGAYDLIIDGSDNFPTRYLVNDLAVFANKPLLYGAIEQFEGQVSLFHAPVGETIGPCYRCLYPEPPAAGTALSCAEAGVFGVLPGVIGSLMAAEALKALLNLGESLSGKLLHYDALDSSWRTVHVARNPNCPVCGDSPSITAPIDYQAFCA